MNQSHCRNILLVLYVLMGVAWSVCVPTFEAPDEPAHLEHIRFIARELCLPVVLPPPNKPVGESFQPPLYYAGLAALRRAVFGGNEAPFLPLRPDWRNDERGCSTVWYQHQEEERFPFSGVAREVHFLRLCSVLIGLMALWFLHQSLVVVFSETSVVPCLALAWAAFLPGFTFVTAVLSNDGLATALGAATLFQAVRMRGGNEPLREWGLLGVTAGCGVLAKLTTVPISAGCCLVLLWLERRNGWRVVACGGCFAAGLLAISGWWFVRNGFLYQDPLGWKAALMASPWTVLPPDYWSPERVWIDANVAITSYWGVFGYLSVSMNHWVYRALYGVTLLGLVSAGWWIQRVWCQWPTSTRRGVTILMVAATFGLVMLIYQCIQNRLAMGRYLYPGYPGHALLAAMAMMSLGCGTLRQPAWVLRLACCVAGGWSAALLCLRRPLLEVTAGLVQTWFQWKPRMMSLDFYQGQGRRLYEAGTWLALGVALAAGVLWAWQVQARESDKREITCWWQKQRFTMALGCGLLIAVLNVLFLAKYLVPAYL